MDTSTVTLDIPEAAYRTAQQVADATGQPLEAILAAGISRSLPPLDDVPVEERPELAALTLLDDAALWREAHALLSDEEQAELHALLDGQAEATLEPQEVERLQRLIDHYARLTLRKAHAYLLLARRGYHVPMQAEAE